MFYIFFVTQIIFIKFLFIDFIYKITNNLITVNLILKDEFALSKNKIGKEKIEIYGKAKKFTFERKKHK